MKFIRVLKAYNEETELYPNSNKATLVFNVTLDFDNPIAAIKFRQHLPKDESQKIHINYDDEKKLRLYSSENPEELLQQDERAFRYRNMDYVLLPNTTHLEFRVYKDIGDFTTNTGKDYTGELEKTRNEIYDLFSHYTQNVNVTLIPPKMKTYDYKNKDFMQMQDRVDSLFEGLSASEIRNYDFVIVGKDKAEAEAIKQYYIQNSRYGATKWQYRKKDDLTDYDKKEGDMTYIKTVSQELDNGIYCLTVRARKYFKDWQGNQETLIPVYDAKASQLGGKVVIAKKNNFIRVLKAGEEEHNKWLSLIEKEVKFINPAYTIFEDSFGFIKIFNEHNERIDDDYRLYEKVVTNLKNKYPQASLSVRDRGYPMELKDDNSISDASYDYYIVCNEY